MNVSFNLDRLYWTLAHDAPDAVIYADANGLIRFWNSAAVRVFGFSESQALGQSLDIIIPANLRARHWTGYAEALRTGRTRYGAGELLAVPALRKDGARISVEFTILPIRGDNGDVLGMAAILRDVTTRFTELRALRKRLVQLDTRTTAVHAMRDVRCPFGLTIELVESFHTANPEHRAWDPSAGRVLGLHARRRKSATLVTLRACTKRSLLPGMEEAGFRCRPCTV